MVWSWYPIHLGLQGLIEFTAHTFNPVGSRNGGFYSLCFCLELVHRMQSILRHPPYLHVHVLHCQVRIIHMCVCDKQCVSLCVNDKPFVCVCVNETVDSF